MQAKETVHRKRKLIGIAIALLVVAIAHHGSLSADFHFDDFHHIVENQAVRNPANLLHFWADPYLFSDNPDHINWERF